MAVIYPPGTAPELEGASITINYHETASISTTDLTGTKWLINSTLSTGSLMLQHLNFTSNATNYTGIWLRLNALSTVTYIIDEDHVDTPYENGWTNEAYHTIEITGGADATNANFVAWLQANATQIVEPSANTYELTHSLTNLSHGNITIQITPDTGYTYPSNITVTNGTLVSYNSATGVAIISGDDTTIISATCAENTLINFSINLNSTLYSFQAKANMTWTEFANSSYNENNNVVISDSNVCYLGIRNQVYSDVNLTNLVHAADTITANTTYYAGQGA